MSRSTEPAKEKILYVDDEEANLVNFTMSLEDQYQVFTALSGEEALRICQREPGIAVLVSDQRMPGMSGLELLEKVDQAHPEMIRIMLTAFTDLEVALEAINRCHVYSFISKPWKEELLLLTIQRAVETHRLIRENRDLSRRLVTVAEEERKRLARDLHDDFGQILPSLRFTLEDLRASLAPSTPEQQRLLAQTDEKFNELGRICRKAAGNLRPDILDRLGLLPTIDTVVNECARDNGIEIELSVCGQPKKMDPECETVIYRVFQESLNNIRDHAAAGKAEVMVTFSYPLVILTIRDNGRGFAEEEAVARAQRQGRGIGLLGMRERVASMAGSFILRSKPGQGTQIRVALPLVRKR